MVDIIEQHPVKGLHAKLDAIIAEYTKEEYRDLIYETVTGTYNDLHMKTDISGVSLQLARLLHSLKSREVGSAVKIGNIEITSEHILARLEEWVNSFLNDQSGGVFQGIDIGYKEEIDDEVFFKIHEPYDLEELQQIIDIETTAEKAREKYRLLRKANKDNVFPGAILHEWYQTYEDEGMFTAQKTERDTGEDKAKDLKWEYYFLYDCMVLIGELPEKVDYLDQKSERVRDCIKAFEKRNSKHPILTISGKIG